MSITGKAETTNISGLSIDDSTHQKTMRELLDYLASFQFQTGIDPQVGMAFEYVAEVLRRMWNDQQAN